MTLGARIEQRGRGRWIDDIARRPSIRRTRCSIDSPGGLKGLVLPDLVW
jgi:hypothetical protein